MFAAFTSGKATVLIVAAHVLCVQSQGAGSRVFIAHGRACDVDQKPDEAAQIVAAAYRQHARDTADIGSVAQAAANAESIAQNLPVLLDRVFAPKLGSGMIPPPGSVPAITAPEGEPAKATRARATRKAAASETAASSV
jgi:hypothetical protein